MPVGDTGAVVGGMAKGAAMLSPNMATMLAVLTTDAEATGDELREILRGAVSTSFNILMTDACRSTNDTVILLASGQAGPVDHDELAAAVGQVCADLASQMAGDAEGATKVVKLTVTGAATPADAEAGARQIAASALCKCSWFGQDPYWGRLASELGSAGIDFDQERVSVSLRRESRSPPAASPSPTTKPPSPSTWPSATSTSWPTSAWVPGRRPCSPTTSPTSTSTRTPAAADVETLRLA